MNLVGHTFTPVRMTLYKFLGESVHIEGELNLHAKLTFSDHRGKQPHECYMVINVEVDKLLKASFIREY